VRGEQVHVDFAAQARLLGDTENLKRFGVTLETVKLLIKPAAAPSQSPGLVLSISDDRLDSDELGELVDQLQFIGLSEQEILRLRLAEPEDILAFCRAEEIV